MKKRWTWLLIGTMIAAAFMLGCSRQETEIADVENLCGEIKSMEGNTLVMAVGNLSAYEDEQERTKDETECLGGVFGFVPSGEMRTVTIDEYASFFIMNGVKQTEATAADMETGDILAITLREGKAVSIVVHSGTEGD